MAQHQPDQVPFDSVVDDAWRHIKSETDRMFAQVGVWVRWRFAIDRAIGEWPARERELMRESLHRKAPEIDPIEDFGVEWDGGIGAWVDHRGNPMDGDRLINCCFPDCGCDGARLCMAESGANFASSVLNIEKGSLAVEARRERAERIAKAWRG